MVVREVPCRETVHFFAFAAFANWLGKDRSLQRGRSSLFLRDLVHICMGEARLSGHNLESGAGHC